MMRLASMMRGSGAAQAASQRRRLTGGDAVFEQGLAADRGGHAEARERRRSAASRTPPEACQAIVGKAAHGFGVQLEVGPGQRAVARDVGAQHVPQAVGQEALDGVPQRQGRGCSRPAVRRTSGVPAGRRVRTSKASTTRSGPNFANHWRPRPAARPRRCRPPRARRRCATGRRRDDQRAHAAADLQAHRLLARERQHDGAVGELRPSRAPSRSTMCSQLAPSAR